MNYYKNLGYDNIIYGSTLEVLITDLPKGSVQKINVFCDICNNIITLQWSRYYKTYNEHNSYVCYKCKSKKTKETNLERYGSVSPMGNKKILEKTQRTNMEKYGNKCTLHNNEISKKTKKSFLEKWGGGIGSHMKSSDIKSKIKNTNMEKYGVEYPSQNEDVMFKIKNTNMEKYGVSNVGESEKIKIKIKNTQFNNFGNWFFVTNKEEISNIKKSHIKNGEHELNKTKKLISRFETINEYDFIEYKLGSIYKIYSDRCEHTFDINNDNFNRRMDKNSNICTICNPIGETSSLLENSVVEFIDTLNISYIRSDKEIISPKHLDIYIPDYKIGIEFNGIYWHSELYKDKNYHINKTLSCNDKGVGLIHIWEDDWLYKKNIVKSIIKNRLGKIENRIYARKCEIKSVKSDIARHFLDNNHIQGFSKSKYKIGLYYNNELVSLMTFGYRRTNSKKEFELIRFCNILDTNVIGGSSKLFNHFLKEIVDKNESHILSYADISMFDGNMYDMLGFDYIHLTIPNYFWVIDGKREHRWKFNKSKLVKDGFSEKMTEVEIMKNRGYYRIFGCGQKRYEYKINH